MVVYLFNCEQIYSRDLADYFDLMLLGMVNISSV
jgi:hypothetical protein